MICENDFCIYNRNLECILKAISLDIDGKCTQCIYISIDKTTLNNIKAKSLMDIEKISP